MLDDTAGLALAAAPGYAFSASPCAFRSGPDSWGGSSTGSASPWTAGRRWPPAQAFRVEGLPIKPSARAGPERVPGDRLHRHRPDEQPGARPEAAALLRRRPAPRPHRRGHRLQCPAARRAGARPSADFAIVFAGIGIPHDERRVLPRRDGKERGAGAHRAVPQPGQRLQRPASADPALCAHRRRVPGLHRGQACPGHPHRPDQLLRGPARGLGQPRRGPEPQGLSGLHVLGSGDPLRARRAHPRAGRGRSPRSRS